MVGMKHAVVGGCSGGIQIIDNLLSCGMIYFEKEHSRLINKKDIEIYFWGKEEDIPKKYLDYGDSYFGCKICGMYTEIPQDRKIYMSIGNPVIKKQYFEYFKDNGYDTPNLIHPTSYVSYDVEIPKDSGIQVMANVTIQMGCKISPNALINDSAVINHECEIGHSSHICPGSILNGNVKIGKCCVIGSNSTIYGGLNIGDNCIISIGSNIVSDISPNTRTLVSVTRLAKV